MFQWGQLKITINLLDEKCLSDQCFDCSLKLYNMECNLAKCFSKISNSKNWIKLKIPEIFLIS